MPFACGGPRIYSYEEFLRVVARPAVMFGPDDVFLTTILELLRRLPIYPMFGRGLTKLQPAYVENVAAAVVSALRGTRTRIASLNAACTASSPSPRLRM